MQQEFDTRPEIGAAFGRHIFMDETRHWRYFSEILQAQSGAIVKPQF